MTYDKPEIVVLASALSAVKGTTKNDPDQIDGDGTKTLSNDAYEADE